MITKITTSIWMIFVLMTASVFAQDEDMQTIVNERVTKMQTYLSLTDAQAMAIRPIVKEYMTSRIALLQETEGQGIVDHVAIKATMSEFKKKEYDKLSKILTKDQLEKWINKENLMSVLNPDSAESQIDDGTTLTPEGASFKF